MAKPKGIWGMVQNAGSKLAATEKEMKALTKVTGLNIHKRIVPSSHPTAKNRPQKIWHANQDLKKAAGGVPVKPGSKSIAMPVAKPPAPIKAPPAAKHVPSPPWTAADRAKTTMLPGRSGLTSRAPGPSKAWEGKQRSNIAAGVPSTGDRIGATTRSRLVKEDVKASGIKALLGQKPVGGGLKPAALRPGAVVGTKTLGKVKPGEHFSVVGGRPGHVHEAKTSDPTHRGYHLVGTTSKSHESSVNMHKSTPVSVHAAGGSLYGAHENLPKSPMSARARGLQNRAEEAADRASDVARTKHDSSVHHEIAMKAQADAARAAEAAGDHAAAKGRREAAEHHQHLMRNPPKPDHRGSAMSEQASQIDRLGGRASRESGSGRSTMGIGAARREVRLAAKNQNPNYMTQEQKAAAAATTRSMHATEKARLASIAAEPYGKASPADSHAAAAKAHKEAAAAARASGNDGAARSHEAKAKEHQHAYDSTFDDNDHEDAAVASYRAKKEAAEHAAWQARQGAAKPPSPKGIKALTQQQKGAPMIKPSTKSMTEGEGMYTHKNRYGEQTTSFTPSRAIGDQSHGRHVQYGTSMTVGSKSNIAADRTKGITDFARSSADKASQAAYALQEKVATTGSRLKNSKAAMDAHEAAARNYDKLGDTKRADEHRKKAKEAGKQYKELKKIPEHEHTHIDTVDDYEHSGDTDNEADRLRHAGANVVKTYDDRDEDGHEFGAVEYKLPKGVDKAHFDAVRNTEYVVQDADRALSWSKDLDPQAKKHYAEVKKYADEARAAVRNGNGKAAAKAAAAAEEAKKKADAIVHAAPLKAAAEEAADLSVRATKSMTPTAHASAARAHEDAANKARQAGNAASEAHHRAQAKAHYNEQAKADGRLD